MTNYAKFFFSANSLPRIGRGDDNKAIIDRMIIIPFNATFSKDDPDFDPFISSKLCQPEVIQALLAKSVMALKRVLAEQGFTEIEASQKAIQEYEVNNNPFEMFVQDAGPDDIENEGVTKIYRQYDVFCRSSNLKPLSMPTFIKRVCDRFDFKTSVIVSGGKKMRIFARKE